MNALTIRIPESLHRNLKDMAKREDFDAFLAAVPPN